MARSTLSSSSENIHALVPEFHLGRKREHRHDKFEPSNSEDSVAAPATVSGEPGPYSHWETGKAGHKGNDPRARRPASAVTQPVDGASIWSGLSQR